MQIAVEDIVTGLAAFVMPGAFDVADIPGRPPVPIALNHLVRGAAPDLGQLDGNRFGLTPIFWPRVPGDMARRVRINGPLRQVAVTPAGKTSFFKRGIIRVPFIGRTMKNFDRAEVPIQRAVGGLGQAAVPSYVALTFITAHIAPAVMERKRLLVVVGVQLKADADLAVIAGAFDSIGSFFSRRQGGQEHGSQDGNDRDHDEQFDERESAALGVANLHFRSDDGDGHWL